MIVKKILNNNVITSNDKDGQEIIIVGKGIGWKQKVGDLIDEEKIDKIFRMDTATSTARLKQLFLEVKPESIQASSEIIDYAKKNLGKDLKKNIYLTLTDHVDFAVERFEKGLTFHNALFWEIRKIYRKEFEIGLYSLKIIEKYFNVRLPEDEAASIAMHLVNSEYDGNMSHTEAIIDIVNHALDLAEKSLDTKLNEESLDYQRFMTHLIFFAQRVIEGKPLKEEINYLFQDMKKGYPKQYQCALEIGNYVNQTYSTVVGNEEITFLMVHIVRVTFEE